MANQFLKLRRSAVPGKTPDTSSLEFGEIALNTYDGLAFIKKSGSNGEEIVAIGSTTGAFTGSFSGSFIGDGSQLTNISFIATGSITASVGIDFDNSFKVENSIPDPSGNNTLFLINASGSIAINTSSFDLDNPETLLIVSHDDTNYNLIVGRSNTDNYSQFNLKNFSSGTLASSDIVATTDDGDENQGYVNMGINSSNYYNPYFVGRARDAYLYSTGDDLWIGNASENKRVAIFSGGPDAEANAKVYIHPAGVIGINTSETASVVSPALPAFYIKPAGPDTYNMITVENNVDNYSQINNFNTSNGTSASADIVATNDIGTETSYYVNMGINGSNYTQLGSVGIANDAYLYSTGRHLHIGNVSNYPIQFFVGGLDSDTNRKLELNPDNQHELTGSLNVSGSVVAHSFTGSLFGTASWAINALTASSADSFVVRNSLTASGLIYPAADNGEESFIQTDGNGNLSLQYVKTIYEEIYNGESFQLVKGTPVYVSGSVGAAAVVYVADPTNPAKMPAVYIAGDTLSPGEAGRGIALGLIKGVDTTGYPAGTEIYLAPGGGWTSSRPTGSVIIQVLGYVTKEGNGGQGVVLNPGPANLPNIQPGYIWVGNNNSTPIAISTSSLLVNTASFATTASSADNFTVRGTLTAQTIVVQTITSSTDYVTGSTIFGSSLNNTHQFTGSVGITGSLIAPIITGSLYGTASWSQNALTASYVSAANVAGLSLFQITTGSITASVGVETDNLFLIKSGSTTYLNISSSGNTTFTTNLLTVKNLNTNQPVLTVSQSVIQFATQSSAPTGTTSAGSIVFTSSSMYIGLE
jgi:hypothetical protein